MGRDLLLILDQCLDDLGRGQSVEECLARNPEVAAELGSLLAFAGELRALRRPEPRREAVQAALVRIGASLPRRSVRSIASARPRVGAGWWRLPALRWATAIAAALVAVVGIGTASARSVPGDLLYPLKLVTERVTFALTTAPESRAELRLSFADSRLDELVRGAQRRGRIDPELLRELLREAELALQDARPAPAARLKLFLAKLEGVNAYQKAALKQLSAAARGGDAELLQRAISVCDERGRWMQKMIESPQGMDRGESCWGPGCDWE